MISVKIIIFINNLLVSIQLIIEIFFLTLRFIVLSIDIFTSFIIEICNCILFS